MGDHIYPTESLKSRIERLRTECERLNDQCTTQQQTIRQLHLTERAHLTAEEHLRTTLNSIGDAVISTDRKGHIVGMNPVAEKLTGRTASQAEKRPLSKVLHLVDSQTRQPIEVPIKQVLQTGTVTKLPRQSILVAKDGTEYLISDSISPIRQSNGMISGVVLVFRDISDQFRIQEQLRWSESLLKTSQEMAHIGSWQHDLVSGRLTWSEEVFRIFGVNPQNFTPSVEAFAERVHPDDRKTVTQAYKDFLENEGGSYQIEHRVIQKDTGQIRHVFEKCINMRNEQGAIIGTIGIVQDITERKLIEQQLRQSRDSLKREIELFESLFQTIPDHMYIKDRQSRFIRLNKSIVDLFELTSEEEAIGKSDFDFFTDAHAQPAYEDEQNIMRTGIPKIGYEEKESWPDGHVTWCLSTKMPMYDNDGQVIGLIGISHDITDRKQAEREREHLLEMLEKKNEELKSIVYIASHDLRSPIVNINGFCSFLKEHCQQLEYLLEDSEQTCLPKDEIAHLLKESIPEDLYYILSGSSKMEKLINGLLQVSRIGTAEVKMEPLDMNELIAGITKSMHFQLEKAGIKLRCDPLPDCIGDRTQIDRVLMNLVDNAIKYRNPQKEGLIHISGQTNELQHVYCVADNGIGIDKAHQDKIFEIFHQLHPDEKAPGQGLGLTIVKRILDRHNGDIWVESEPGRGSRFFVSMPISGKTLS